MDFKGAQAAHDAREPVEVPFSSVVECLNDYTNDELADLIFDDEEYARNIIQELVFNDRKAAIRAIERYHDAASLGIKLK